MRGGGLSGFLACERGFLAAERGFLAAFFAKPRATLAALAAAAFLAARACAGVQSTQGMAARERR